MNSPPPPPQWSPDGEWWWNGAEWVHRSRAYEPRHRELSSLTVFGVPLGVIALVVIGYLVFHWWHYHNCFFPPGIFEWPQSCL